VHKGATCGCSFHTTAGFCVTGVTRFQGVNIVARFCMTWCVPVCRVKQHNGEIVGAQSPPRQAGRGPSCAQSRASRREAKVSVPSPLHRKQLLKAWGFANWHSPGGTA